MEVAYSTQYNHFMVTWPKHAGTKNWEGKLEAKRNIEFKDGNLILDSDKDKDVIEMLDSHPGNEANGGSSFRKQPDDIRALLAIERGETWATTPDGGINDGDISALKYLDQLSAQLTPNAMKKALDIAASMYDRFKLRGVARPVESDKAKRLRAKITEIVETIKERGLWNDNPSGKEPAGQTETKNQ